MASPAELRDDDSGRRLLGALLAVDADTNLRYECMKAKCDELEHVLSYVVRVRAARAKSHAATQRRHEAEHAESRDLETSIGEAIRRARQIRSQMAHDAGNEVVDGDGGSSGSRGRRLEEILQQARALQDKEEPETQEEHRGQEKQHTDATLHQEISPHSVPAVRLEYPRRMKLLMGQLVDALANERELSFRGAFCRKMTEYLSLRESERGGRQGVEKVRVQVAFPVQVERLQLAYRRLGQYVDTKANADSEAVQKALNTPSMSSVFPVYCRLKQARALAVQLDEAAISLAHRLPPRPILSDSGRSHRDAMMERFRKKSTTLNEATAGASNRLFPMRHPASDISSHTALLHKLQRAWEDAQRTTQSRQQASIKPYENTVDMTVLSDVSTLVLSAFQSAFCNGERSPPDATIRELMGVIRVAESAVVYKGRRQRSVVRR